MALPTVILVHGAWHTPANYASFIAALRTQGFPVHCPLLPSCTESLQPKASLEDDIAAVRELASSLIATGQRILMIMHSYGGAVGSEAVQGLAAPSPTSTSPGGPGGNGSGAAGGVIHLLYLCAYILPPAVSVWDIVVEAGFDRIFDQYVETADDGSIFPLDPALMFFGGDETMPRGVIDEALKTLVRFPRSALTTRIQAGPGGRGRGGAEVDIIPGAGDGNLGCPNPVWASIPATYVTTAQDYGVPRPYQDIMLAKVKAQGVQMRIEDVDTCHSVFISRERKVVRIAVEAAHDERN
ncbi:alpha/beta hydrolase [Aspergillus stella-maris]|uniref:alpha/beta hydrolase n=1 Tax=Aspergillus stella-maris TaxID=1810926 RepID=UPI003CCD3CE1